MSSRERDLLTCPPPCVCYQAKVPSGERQHQRASPAPASRPVLESKGTCKGGN